MHFPDRFRCARLAGVLLLASGTMGAGVQALAQDGSSVQRVERRIDRSAALEGERSVPFRLLRPLRTFRGRPVQVGSVGRRELSIGVVRAFRADGSKSIGVVRPIRNRQEAAPQRGSGGLVAFSPVRRTAEPATTTTTAGPGLYPTVLVPGIDSGGLGTASLQIFAGQPRPVADQANPWDLLNAGRYHAAAERFDAVGDAADRTGAALAAMLAGDLAGAAAMLPAEPVLPQGVDLDRSTVMRLRQVAAVFFVDDAVVRDALRGLLNGS